MECYAHGYPAPRLRYERLFNPHFSHFTFKNLNCYSSYSNNNSWYKEVDPNNPTALIPLTEKSFKYKFEATIPEPDVCTDCILARITVINVISGDYGTYVLKATSEQNVNYMSQDKVRLYRKQSILFCTQLNCFVVFSVIFETCVKLFIYRNSGVPTVDHQSGQQGLSQSSSNQGQLRRRRLDTLYSFSYNCNTKLSFTRFKD